MDMDTVVARDPELAAAFLDDKAVVLSIVGGAYFDFNEVGTEIWEMLARPCRVREIFQELLRRYAVDEKTLTAQVTPFLRTLAEHRLIRTVSDGQGQ